MRFGRHLGEQYIDVYNNHPTYCNWVLETAEHGEKPSKELQRFAEYLLFQAPVALPTAIQTQREKPAANQVVFPDTDWNMTDWRENQPPTTAGFTPRRSQQNFITDEDEGDL